ncbi:MAG: phosphoesterase [Chloroflexi bacterium]|nr:MAG: phosphoesterase [Chloroflexota bacterium]
MSERRSQTIWYRMRIVALAALLLTLLAACSAVRTSPPAASYDAEVATSWFGMALNLVQKTPGFTPPVASRVFGYLGVALYETVRPGLPGYRSLAGQLNGLETLPQPNALARYHWPAAANSALASLTHRLFPTAPPEMMTAVDALEAYFAQEFAAQEDATTLARSAAWGKIMANAIYAWSMTDGGHEGYLHSFSDAYLPPSGPGMWVSTPPTFAQALQPYWGQNRPFVLSAADDCPAPPPPAYSEEANSPFYAEALEVYDSGRSRSEEQVQIALFWADDPGRTATPPGHWISILGQILEEGSYTLDKAAEAYAKVGVVVTDAFITCWRTKYQYNLLRPITYIQQVIDTEWNASAITDPVITPPFPEYTSGHSVQSSAVVVVLTSLFGEGYAFTDHTHDALGLPPHSFPSFTAAAEEAAISRLYGGIHYRSAIVNGLAQGRCVAEKILALDFQQ